MRAMDPPASPLQVLLVDDDPKLVSLLARGLAFEGYDVATAADGEVALAAVDERAPHVVLLDIAMPGMDGFEVCRRLRMAHDVPVIMLTARDDVTDTVTGLRLGADDYVGKPFAFEELLARIESVLRRRGTVPSALTYADLTLDPATREVRRGSRQVELTPTEFGLLVLLLRRPSQVLTRGQLIESVWGPDAPEQGALDVHIGHLRHKLERCGEPRLVVTVRGVGFSLRG